MAEVRRAPLRSAVDDGIDGLRQLALAFFAGQGLMPVAEYPHQDGLDLIFDTSILTQAPRSAVARLCAGHASARTLSDLSGAAAADARADYLLIARTADGEIAADERVLCGDQLERLWLDAWAITDSRPGAARSVDREALKLLARIRASEHQPFRPLLRSALVLARNRVPYDLAGEGTADDLFERYVFQMLTGILRLEGRRFGTAAKGKRVGDALVSPATCDRPIVVDCKAAAAGYLMSVADERKLVEYATAEVEWGNYRGRPAGVLVISGGFQGSRAAVHPYEARRANLQAAGSQLWYLRIDDVIAAILAAPRDLWNDTDALRRVNWHAALSSGVITRAALIAALQEPLR